MIQSRGAELDRPVLISSQATSSPYDPGQMRQSLTLNFFICYNRVSTVFTPSVLERRKWNSPTPHIALTVVDGVQVI